MNNKTAIHLATCLFVTACIHSVSNASTSEDRSAHFCQHVDYEQWHRNHPPHASKRAADLNVGEPRTVRLILFSPDDRPFRVGLADSIKTAIKQIQAFFGEQMQAHGFDYVTFRLETDAVGEPLVHHMVGDHSDSHYLDVTTTPVFQEIEKVFDRDENIYVVFVDNSIDALGIGAGRRAGGSGSGYKKRGNALVPGSASWQTVAHEIGHAFGLWHDFRDNRYIMSYGGRQRRTLSACAAEFLEVHPYFNAESSLESHKERLPIVELISPVSYTSGASNIPIQLRIADPAGLHQVILNVSSEVSTIKACRGLSGEKEAVLEFVYDGRVPSSSVSSVADRAAHPIGVWVVNTQGDIGRVSFTLVEVSPYLSATFAGHADRVNSVSFSPDGTRLVSGSRDGRAILWDVETGKQMASLEGHRGAVNAVSFSPDGKTLVSGSRDGRAILWDVETAKHSAALDGHQGAVNAVSFSPDGTRLAAASATDVVLWDVETSKQIVKLQGHTGPVLSVSISPGGGLLASGGGWEDFTVRLWDLTTHREITVLGEHSNPVLSVSFSPDGATVASASTDRSVILWDVETGEKIGTLNGHRSGVVSLSFLFPYGGMLATGSADRTAVLWDLFTLKEIATFGHTDQIRAVSLSRGGSILAGGGLDGKILLWDVSDWTRPRPAALVIISGIGQQSAPGDTLAQPLMVEVRDQYGNPLAGASVTFTITAGGGALADTTVTTDTNGRAGTTLRLGRKPGTNTVVAAVSDVDPETFNAKGIALADFDGDGVVGFPDFLQFAARFGLSRDMEGYDARYDLDGDGSIAFGDFLIFAAAFGT